MESRNDAALHDAYAADYDEQMRTYSCHLPDVLFGLCYEYVRPGQVLLDAGIGSGLSARLFAKAGLTVHGMDFSPAMLDICRAKGFAAELRRHDLLEPPWPYDARSFDHVVCCGVLHFVRDPEAIVAEAARVLRPAGIFAFTTKVAPSPAGRQAHHRQEVGGFAIYAHSRAAVEALLGRHACAWLKTQACFVGDDLFMLWVAQRGRGPGRSA